MPELTDAVVILTGAAGGIGRATTKLLVDRRARVLAVDRDEEGLAELVRLHGAGRVTPVVADLTEIQDGSALASSLRERHGRLDVLINNAGLTVQAAFGAMDNSEIDRVLDVDLLAPIHLTRAVFPHLEPGGHVAFVSSMAGLQAFPTQSTYSAAKFGLRGFAEALAMEAPHSGVTASLVLPGTIATGFLDNAASHDRSTTERLARLMRRFGTPPRRVAEAIVDGIENDGGTRRVGWDCWALSAAQWLCPPLLPLVLQRAYRHQWPASTTRSDSEGQP